MYFPNMIVSDLFKRESKNQMALKIQETPMNKIKCKFKFDVRVCVSVFFV